MYRVTKRDGTIAEFDIAKISSAITKAFDAMGDRKSTRLNSSHM